MPILYPLVPPPDSPPPTPAPPPARRRGRPRRDPQGVATATTTSATTTAETALPLPITPPPPAPTPLADQTSEALMDRVRDYDDREAFALLHDRHHADVRYITSYWGRGSSDRANDATQTSWAAAHRNRHQYESGRPFIAWIFGIAKYAAIDEHRKQARHSAVSLESLAPGQQSTSNLRDLLIVRNCKSPVDAALGREQVELVHSAMGRLSPIFREIIELVCFQDMLYREAADRLNIPVGIVKSRLWAALKKLRFYLRSLDPNAGL